MSNNTPNSSQAANLNTDKPATTPESAGIQQRSAGIGFNQRVSAWCLLALPIGVIAALCAPESHRQTVATAVTSSVFMAIWAHTQKQATKS